MEFKKLLKEIDVIEVRGDIEFDVNNICYDSRKVNPGDVFVAMPGHAQDGRDFIKQAVERGALAVIFEGLFFDNLRCAQVRVLGARLALARLSAAFFVHPTSSFKLIGLTGTNGKTTLSYLLEAIWKKAGLKTGVVGTVNQRFGDRVIVSGQTTPESRDLQELFSLMKNDDVQGVFIEVSSHALLQSRVAGCEFDGAVFTNLTQDHLDYHKSMEDYFAAKKILFSENLLFSRKKRKAAVICVEDEFGQRLNREMKEHASVQTLSYSLQEGADIYPQDIKMSLDGLEMQVSLNGQQILIQSSLIGSFNALNVLGALGMAALMGIDINTIQEALKEFKTVTGRLERVVDSEGRIIFVDYAHTPDALKNILSALKPLSKKKLITVFGCGGDRDKSKRPLMGFEAASLSDICLVTSDNPRSENPEKILEDIVPGVKRAGLEEYDGENGYLKVIDRKMAIHKALELSTSGDVIVIAGKGHEDYQILGQQKIFFSDQQVVLDWMAERK